MSGRVPPARTEEGLYETDLLHLWAPAAAPAGSDLQVRYEGTQHSFRTDIYWMYQPCTRCGKHFMVGRFTLYDGKVRM